MSDRSILGIALGLTLLSLPPNAWAQPDTTGGIGVYTAVRGSVSVIHHAAATTASVSLHDPVFFRDVIETQAESQTKAFFQDDSLLTVGESSRVEITEHIYNPDQSQRSVVVNLLQGKVRALVSKVFSGVNSRFEIHTPTAVAAARGTYFVVWTEGVTSGIANIGTHGNVGFTSGGQTVEVLPGQYSLSEAGKPPLPPVVLGRNTSSALNYAVRATEVKDQPKA